MLTKKDKKMLIDALKSIDVKLLEIDLDDPKLVKWFRFGSYNGLRMACKVIEQLPERKSTRKKIDVS